MQLLSIMLFLLFIILQHHSPPFLTVALVRPLWLGTGQDQAGGQDGGQAVGQLEVGGGVEGGRGGGGGAVERWREGGGRGVEGTEVGLGRQQGGVGQGGRH